MLFLYTLVISGKYKLGDNGYRHLRNISLYKTNTSRREVGYMIWSASS